MQFYFNLNFEITQGLEVSTSTYNSKPMIDYTHGIFCCNERRQPLYNRGPRLSNIIFLIVIFKASFIWLNVYESDLTLKGGVGL